MCLDKKQIFWILIFKVGRRFTFKRLLNTMFLGDCCFIWLFICLSKLSIVEFRESPATWMLSFKVGRSLSVERFRNTIFPVDYCSSGLLFDKAVLNKIQGKPRMLNSDFQDGQTPQRWKSGEHNLSRRSFYQLACCLTKLSVVESGEAHNVGCWLSRQADRPLTVERLVNTIVPVNCCYIWLVVR